MYDYNSSKESLVLREYGRNIQMLVKYIKSLDDKEKRNKAAETLVALMRQISPGKETTETTQKLWDDLFIMADFDLDVDSPYPPPEKDVLMKKPQRMSYSSNDIAYKHYGRNIELLVKNAMEIEDPQDRENAVIYIGKLMKSFFLTWNRDNIDDESILGHIKKLSDNKLDIDIEKVKKNNLFETLYKNKPRKQRKPRPGGKRKRK